MAYSFYISPESYLRASQNGISKRTLEQRIQDMGWHTERAITTPIKQRKEYGNWIKIAEQNGISSQAFRKRINSYGFELERAATQPLMDFSSNMKKVGERNRVYSKETLQQASDNGISYGTFISRIQDKWSIEDAVKVSRRKNGAGWSMGPSIIVKKGVKV